MIFSSIAYLFFLTLVVFVYYISPERWRWAWILIASLGYYISFVPVIILPLICIVFVNYFLGKWIASSPDGQSNRALVLTIVLNILLLSFFKYFNSFFPHNNIHLYNVDLFFRIDRINKMIMPLGLSYLVFTLLSYHIEIKRKTIQPEKHIGYFTLFLFFFPKIAQGPIERPQNLIPQLHQKHHFDIGLITEGLKLIIWGYFKKLVVADRLAIYVNAVYNNNERHTGPSLLVATIFFAFQIYADFSGYTDIALGSAKLFGINLTNNFKRPYFSTSIKEFWNRWHITFSTWLRDYLFLPAAYFLSNKMEKERYFLVSKEKWIYFLAITLTFAICGVWHGVGWTYLVWGLLFGIYLTYSNWSRNFNKKIRKRLKIKKSSGYFKIYKILLTFTLVLFTWIFFRADNIGDAFKIIHKILTFSGKIFFGQTSEVMNSFFHSVIAIFLLVLIEAKEEFFTAEQKNPNWIPRALGYSFLIILILFLGVFDGGQFIYFQY